MHFIALNSSEDKSMGSILQSTPLMAKIIRSCNDILLLVLE